MADAKDVLSAALKAAHSAVSFLPPAEPRRAANSSWSAIKAVLDYNFADDAARPLQDIVSDPRDLLWALRAIENVQAELQSKVDVAEALQWVNKLQTTAGAVAAKLALALVEDVKPKVELEPLSSGQLEVMVIDDSDDEVSADEKPVIDDSAARLPPPPVSNSNRPARRSSARQASAISSFAATPEDSPPPRSSARRSLAPELDEKEPVKKVKKAKVPSRTPSSPASSYPNPLSVIDNPFQLPATLNRPSDAAFQQLRNVGHFHNEDFPGSNMSTIRNASSYGWRFFLSSWTNLGIDWEAPKPGEPCVMLNSMEQDKKGRWIDSRWLKIAREYLDSGAPIGVVVAAANSTAEDRKSWTKTGVKSWANPAEGGGKKWYPLGRYVVREMGSAPAGAFSRASTQGRTDALASFRQVCISRKHDWNFARAGVFPGADEEKMKVAAEAGGDDFMERLGHELNNSTEQQRLIYTILEYHSPYDEKELGEAMEERRTGVKKAAITAARKATVARNAAARAAGTFVEPKKGKGRKKVASPPPESDAEDSDSVSAQVSEWDSAREDGSDEGSGEESEVENNDYED